MNQDFPEAEVFIETQGPLGIVTLNRPRVMNALSLEMIRSISSALRRWEEDSAVQAVVFKSSSERAFCSGGDIRPFYYCGMDTRRGIASPKVPLVFFGEEYSLNKQIFHYSKPTIAMMNGITMGGGYGIAGHSDLRLTGPRTVFAMPEAAIGLFPDVGSLYHLRQCPHNYGLYLMLTGNRLDGPESVAAGLADVYLHDFNTRSLVDSIAGGDDFDIEKIAERIGGEKPDELANARLIEECFAQADVHTVLKKLEENGSANAADIFSTIEELCPISLLVSAAYTQRAVSLNFDEMMNLEFIMVQHFISQTNLYEGIRAKVIDKDNQPMWVPSSIKNVSDQDVNTYFTPTGYDLTDVQIF